eukprot:TRINITY_DN38543_c0_g1_i1.p1 TRINITY_DN38543_c0_g1~~TRINITY_DN38543_c0_g1_i1.p1  ORF type:complete len:205 (-),score=13.41 TRINITY_DN38543_c0_g1_i1:161-775(-)
MAKKNKANKNKSSFEYSKRAMEEQAKEDEEERRLVRKSEAKVEDDASGDFGISPKYVSLAIWIIGLQAVGGVIGLIISPEIQTWYKNLNLPPVNPPNWVFPIAWTILYTLIAISGWVLQYSPSFPGLSTLRNLNWLQLILNWSWCFLFFSFHTTGIALVVQLVMDVAVILIIWLSYGRIRIVALLLLPYLFWLLFATYLNWYVY